jgi:hypothetical protein
MMIFINAYLQKYSGYLRADKVTGMTTVETKAILSEKVK